ncbi:hypothetical protein DIPPA_10413 [Diplonema papillatum]|nr:hypothetical protein DIPPA_10413 [Diplonema papillatum]
MRAPVALFLVVAACRAAEEEAEAVNEFQDLDKEITNKEDSWLSLETWNHMRVGMFVDHIAPEFEKYGCTFSGAVWKDKSILGSYLKSTIHDHLSKETLEKMGLGKTNKEKYTILGFPADADLRKEAIKAFKARVNREAMRRSDHAFRLKLAGKKKVDPREKARKALKLEKDEVCPFSCISTRFVGNA